MGILDSMYIGSNALKAHGNRLDVHAKNIANIDTPNYVRKIPVLNSIQGESFNAILNNMQDGTFGLSQHGALSGGVSYGGIVEDPTPGERIYKPGHPDADASGYIRSSNVNAMVEYALSFQGIPYVYGGNGTAAQCYKWTQGSSCSVHKKGVKYTDEKMLFLL